MSVGGGVGLLFGEEGGVGVDVATEVAGEEPGLEVGEEADGGFFVEEGVADFLLFAFLPMGEDGFSGVFFEEDSSVFHSLEIVGGDLLAVDQGEGGTVGKEGAEFFHEVEGEGGAPGAFPVEEADLRVQSCGFRRAAAVVGEEGVEEGEKGVDGIQGRSAAAAGKGEGVAGREGDEVVEDGKVGDGGFAFSSPELF